MNNFQDRFKGINWYDKMSEIHSVSVYGQGGIGSWLTFLLSRTLKDTSIFTHDFDSVESYNIGGQLFSKKNIGDYKSYAMQAFTYDYGIAKVYPSTSEFKEDMSVSNGVVFSCFDNMKARKLLFEAWKESTYHNKIFIDGRLLAENYEVFFVTPKNQNRYEEYLFDDSEIPDVACTAKQTSHFAAAIAADMVKGFTNWVANNNGDVRILPFRIKEIGELFHKEVEE